MINASMGTEAAATPAEKAFRIARQILLVGLGTLVLTVSAKTKVPLGLVDISLQTLAVMLLSAFLGMRLGVATVALYVAEGMSGLPVFQSSPEHGIGLAYIMGPTGGYLLGFVAMAAIVGWAADRRLYNASMAKFLGVLLLAEAVMTALGFAWLASLIGAERAWQAGVVPFIVGDLIKVALAAAIVPAVLRPFRNRA